MTLAILILSVFIAALAIPGAWLQFLRVRSEGTSEGLSITFIAVGSSSAASWLTYGLFAHNSLQVVCNVSGAAAQLLTLALMVRMAPQLWRVLAAVGVYVAVMVAVGAIFGPDPLATLGALLGFSCRVPQVLKSWREPGGAAISVPNFMLAGMASFGWLAYAIMTGNVFVLASASTTIVVSMFIVMRTVRSDTVIEDANVEDGSLALA